MQAQHFAARLYSGVPRKCLTWSHRRALLREEMHHWKPDVVCMQEVQHYADVEEDMRQAG